MKKKIVKLQQLPTSNKHLPEPFKKGEKFIVMPKKAEELSKDREIFSSQFYKLFRVSNKKQYVLAKRYF